MQGRGVITYSSNEPNHGWTTRTTEFDDQLIQRGIVSSEQAMLAKGASSETALRLAQEKLQNNPMRSLSATNNYTSTATEDITNFQMKEDVSKKAIDGNDDEDEDDDYEPDDEDEFFVRYREVRLAELKQKHEQQKNSRNSHGTVIQHITRNEWTIKINEASHDQWVVVTLVDSSHHSRIVQELHNVARRLQQSQQDETADIIFLTIQATDAIPNWPSQRVPSMFAYRDGIKQYEWIANANGHFPTSDQLEHLLLQWKLLED